MYLSVHFSSVLNFSVLDLSFNVCESESRFVGYFQLEILLVFEFKRQLIKLYFIPYRTSNERSKCIVPSDFASVLASAGGGGGRGGAAPDGGGGCGCAGDPGAGGGWGAGACWSGGGGESCLAGGPCGGAGVGVCGALRSGCGFDDCCCAAITGLVGAAAPGLSNAGWFSSVAGLSTALAVVSSLFSSTLSSGAE